MLARDLMTKNVTTLRPEDSLLKAAQIIFENNWDGLPVVSYDSSLMGIVTQYDLVTKGANIHMPTFVQLISQMKVFKKDVGSLKPELQKIVTLTVGDVMNPEPLTVLDDSKLEDVARAFAEHHRVNPIPVVDYQKRLVGIISRFDLIKLYAGVEGVADAIVNEKSIDKKVDMFVEGMEKNFLVVSKSTPLFWKIISVFFLILGFIIAMALIIRIELKN